jgi:HEPN domain-containing protein
MRNLEAANTWLKRAKSNMARAKAGRVSSEILYEDLCFDAQQAVEIEIAEKVLTWVKKGLDKEQLPPDPQRSLFE